MTRCACSKRASKRARRRRQPSRSCRPSSTRTRRSSRSSTSSSSRPCATARPTCTSSRRPTSVRVRVRTDGALHEITTLPGSMGPSLVSRIKVMADMNIVERRRPQDGQMRVNVDGRDLDVRVSTTPTVFGEKCVMRILDKTRAVIELPALGMSAETVRALLRPDPVAVRHGDLRGPDRFGQDHDALRDARRDQQRRDQRHDDRGPGRVRVPDDQPDPDQRAGGRHVRERAALDPAPGPRRDPRRRDPRRRDRAHRDAGRAHRSLRRVVVARDRRDRPRCTASWTWASSRS